MGMTLRRIGRFPESTATVLNAFIINISLPALTLYHIHNITIDHKLLMPMSMPWVIFLVGIPFFLLLGKLLKLKRETIGCLILVGGLGNTSFVGLPMIETFYGREFVGIGIVADQAGSFIVLSTLGIVVASIFAATELNVPFIAKKIALFPPTQALLLALLLRSWEYPVWLNTILMRLGDTLTPIALVSIGFLFQLRSVRQHARPLILGLSYKLLLAPALIWATFIGLWGASGSVFQVTVFEAAMPPMISAGIIAMEHRLDISLVSTILGVGLLLSSLTLTGWWYFLLPFF